MHQVFPNTGNSPRSYIPSKAVSLSQTLSNIASDPYASSLPQHASQSYLEPPDTASIAPPTRYASIADCSIAEPTKLHHRTVTGPARSTSDLPPLISRSSDSTNLSTAQFSVIPQLDPSSQLDDFHPSPQQSRQSSPTRSNRFSVLTGKSEEKAGKLAGWFKGESKPISVGIIPSPTKEKSDPLDSIAESSDIRATNLLQRLSTTQVMPKPAMASRFSFFSSKASLVKPIPLPDELSDELLEMDVSAALFPNEPPNPFSPASFKNLQQQAEGLLSRLQTAYKERTIALRDMMAEKETVAEESEGVETRARHLKMQLDGMTAKFAEQDEAMMNLVDELAQEKQARREEEEARKRTVRVVGDVTSPSSGHRGLMRSNTVSDSGFESEDDSSADSVFSRRDGARSPNMSVSSASTTNSPDVYRTQEFHVSASTADIGLLRLPQGQPAAKGTPVHACTNCEGVRASEAWSVVSILKEENEALKHRVGELEGALDGCLDVVGRLS
ncbi:hypothetical protein HO133_000547 [Letharia lupina]|uniref:Uncharacterized protein n=1 Tax=Letharia lupina TaxID=560253 RepID=A0A8H6CI94_9LECA|nr:uncharacterized protein HO133_000547 [Letharia lupina]KAF6223704.1 hypothetical protein HO133_000547 [Letharia lupina]